MLPANNFELIKQAIVSAGTVAAGFTVYDDIYYYAATIYTKSATAVQSGGHAVAVIGYGTEGTQAYWIFANSWGTGNPSNPSVLAL
jgi:cathepsin B